MNQARAAQVEHKAASGDMVSDRSVNELPLPPGPKNPLNMLACNLAFLVDPAGTLARLYETYGPVTRFRLGFLPIVLLVGPEANRFLMTTSPKKIQAGPIWRRILPFYDGALLTNDGEAHKRQRQLLQDVSNLKRVADHMSIMIETVRERAARWGTHIDLYEEMEHLSLGNATRALVGFKLSEQQHKDFFRWHRSIAAMILSVPVNNLPLTARWRGQRAKDKMWRVLEEIVRQRRDNPGDDTLSDLIAACDSQNQSDKTDPNRLSEDEVLVHTFTMLAAGHATLAAMMTFAIAVLLVRQDLMKRLLQEGEEQLGDEQPTLERIHRLSFTFNLLREVERLYPPVPYIARTAVADLAFGGYRIPADTTLMGSLRLTHLMPKYFANPLEFDPDRYAKPRDESKTPFALAGFGGGPHICLGMNFAHVETCIVLHTLFRHYRLKLVGAQTIPQMRFRPFGAPHKKIVVEVKKVAEVS